MRILYIATISDTINSFLIPHIKLLVEQGNEVGVAFNPIQEINPELIQLGCTIYHVHFQRDPLKKENLAAYKKIKQIVLEDKYELIHVHTPVASFLTRLACRNMPEVKILYTAHGFHFFKGASKMSWILYLPFEKMAAKWTDGLITMNNEDYILAKKLKLRKSNAIYKVHGVGINLNYFVPQTLEEKSKLRKEYHYNLNDFIIIYVGELSDRKHQSLLIEAVSILRKKIPNIKLLLVGDGVLKNNYKTMVNNLNLDENVEILGYREDVSNLMIISDLAVSTSRREGLPVNVMEAMATGLPLIVTNCRGNRDLIKNGVNGIVIKNDEVKECADAIEKLYTSKELRSEYGEKNKILIQAYSIENVIGEMREIYSYYK